MFRREGSAAGMDSESIKAPPQSLLVTLFLSFFQMLSHLLHDTTCRLGKPKRKYRMDDGHSDQ